MPTSANISLNIIDNLHVQCPPSWEEHNITVDISLTKQNKENTSELAYQKEFFRIKEKFSNHYALFTDGSKLEEKVAVAAYFPEHPDRSKATRLRDGASVFSAELDGIALALTEIKKLTKYHKDFVIYSDSLSAHPMFTSLLSGFLLMWASRGMRMWTNSQKRP
ncbi:Gag-Pol polyprotein [Plakobranchus ocellatus]|uniref:Gag-Pol polyprotein n=1 Tax=Plakobranchus ocellatus TaxID=259542 RepID=A0AAV4AL73_9GAST|nr:Gag-Pol polyprotein [Plakobranchus ocellatus]